MIRDHFKNKYKLELKNIVLREISKEDTDFVVSLRNHADIRKWFSSNAEITEEGHKSFLKKYFSPNNSDEIYIIENDEGPAGMISLYNISDIDAEWGRIAVHPKAQGNGVGRKALMLIIERAKQKCLRNLYCHVKKNNIKAISLYESLQFKIEGENGDEFRMNFTF